MQKICIMGKEYELLMNLKAMKQIEEKCGGLEQILTNTENLTFVLMTLVNCAIEYNNLINTENIQEPFTLEEFEILAEIPELNEACVKVAEAMNSGFERKIKSADDEQSLKKNNMINAKPTQEFCISEEHN